MRKAEKKEGKKVRSYEGGERKKRRRWEYTGSGKSDCGLRQAPLDMLGA